MAMLKSGAEVHIKSGPQILYLDEHWLKWRSHPEPDEGYRRGMALQIIAQPPAGGRFCFALYSPLLEHGVRQALDKVFWHFRAVPLIISPSSTTTLVAQ